MYVKKRNSFFELIVAYLRCVVVEDRNIVPDLSKIESRRDDSSVSDMIHFCEINQLGAKHIWLDIYRQQPEYLAR